MATYYKIDSRRLTCAEYRRFDASRWLVLCFLKWCNVPIPMQAGIPRPAPASESRVEISSLNDKLRNIVDSFVGKMTALGFRDPLCHRLNDALVPAEQIGVTMLHDNKRTVARLCYAKGAVLIKSIALVSWLDTGDFLVTSNGKHYLNDPPGIQVTRYVEMEPKDLLEHHVAALHTKGSAQKLETTEQVESLVDALESFIIVFNVQRGLYKEMSEAEVNSARARFEEWRITGALPKPSDPAWLVNGVVWGFALWAVSEVFRYTLKIDLDGYARLVLFLAFLSASLLLSHSFRNRRV